MTAPTFYRLAYAPGPGGGVAVPQVAGLALPDGCAVEVGLGGALVRGRLATRPGEQAVLPLSYSAPDGKGTGATTTIPLPPGVYLRPIPPGDVPTVDPADVGGDVLAVLARQEADAEAERAAVLHSADALAALGAELRDAAFQGSAWVVDEGGRQVPIREWIGEADAPGQVADKGGQVADESTWRADASHLAADKGGQVADAPGPDPSDRDWHADPSATVPGAA